MAYHPETNVPGRGTEEVKTNDVTGRVKRGEVGIGIEIGRPSTGADMHDVELFTNMLAKLNYIEFEKDNPVLYLLEDVEKGKIAKDLIDRKVLSAIIEFTIPIEKMKEVIKNIKKVAKNIDTVLSLEVITIFENNQIPTQFNQIIKDLNMSYRPNAKVNLGLGRPLKEE